MKENSENLIKNRISSFLKEASILEKEFLKITKERDILVAEVKQYIDAKKELDKDVETKLKETILSNEKFFKMSQTLDNKFNSLKELYNISSMLDIELDSENKKTLETIIQNTVEHYIVNNDKVEKLEPTEPILKEMLEKHTEVALKSFIESYKEQIA